MDEHIQDLADHAAISDRLARIDKSLHGIERQLRGLDARIMGLRAQIRPRRFAGTITLGVASGIILAILVMALMIISMVALGVGIDQYLFWRDPNAIYTQPERAKRVLGVPPASDAADASDLRGP